MTKFGLLCWVWYSMVIFWDSGLVVCTGTVPVPVPVGMCDEVN